MKTGVVLFILMIAVSAFAEITQPEGDGTSENPYQIESLANLRWMSVTGLSWTKRFIQTCDINASETIDDPFVRIANLPGYNAFTGVYNGMGYVIDSLHCNGLFGTISEAEIRNLGMTNLMIDADEIIGGMICLCDSSQVINCNTSGRICQSAQLFTGGLIGECSAGSVISGCHSSCEMYSDFKVGGLIGRCANSTILDCWTDGLLAGGLSRPDRAFIYAGGLIAWVYSSLIQNCYCTGIFDYTDYLSCVGGFIGQCGSSEVIGCYSSMSIPLAVRQSGSVGGFIGRICSSDISDCYSEGNLICSVGFSFGYQASIGGFAGIVERSTIENCHSTGDIDDETGDCTIRAVGAFVGLLSCDEETYVVRDCYATGDVAGGYMVGGFIGSCGGYIVTDCWSSGNVRGATDVGGFIGKIDRVGTVVHCDSYSDVQGESKVGGFIGLQDSGSIVRFCKWGGTVSGTEYVGGFAGYSSYSTTDNCISDGFVEGEEYVGGFTGRAFMASISNSYSESVVNGDRICGGFVGHLGMESSISKCYSVGSVSGIEDVGGFAGSVNEAGIYNSFWNIESSGQSESAGGTGLTTEEMQTLSTYLDAGWDFVNETGNGNADYWSMLSDFNNGYPYLAWQNVSPVEDEDVIPVVQSVTALHANYPNPFNPSTTISFSVAGGEVGNLTIYNLKGQKVMSYPDFQAGEHEVVWNGRDDIGKSAASGVYFYRLVSGEKSIVRKMMLLK